MPIRSFLPISASTLAVLTLASPATPQARQTVTPPKARYAMDVGTMTGMALTGGGGKEAHELRLRLGSTLAPTGTANADHFVPAGLRMGKSLPLVTPAPSAASREPGEMPKDFQRPKGRLLLFWGCGERAGPGQPVVIDFAKLAAGQMPPNLFSANVPADRGPVQSNSRTYGDWPNGRSNKAPGNGSLVGQHRIAGTYSPEISFALQQDWMAGLNARNAAMPSEAVNLSWSSVPAATGYYAWAFGASGDPSGQQTDMVWWSSSMTREFGGGLWDWLPPEVVARLVTQKVVMPPQQTSCIIPSAVRQASPQFMMGNLTAYGPEANFVYPQRPANPREAWNQEWTARVRYRSTTGMMIGGPDMGAAMRGEDEREEPRPKKCKGVGGMLGGMLSGRGC
jgi:hypothetical protein